MSTVFSLPKQRVFATSGAALPGAKLYFYATGTSSAKATYSDRDLNTPHENPVVADAYGVFPVIFLEEGEYRVRLVSSSGAQQWQVDEVGGGTIDAEVIGAALYPQTAAELSAGVTPTNYQYEPGNVLRYGTNTTPGTTDMTAAIQAAANSSAEVTAPPQQYKVTSTITVPAGTTINGYGAELVCTSSQFNALLLGSGCGVYGLALTGPASATYDANGIGIKCFGTNNSPSAPTFIDGPVIRDCTIQNFGLYGIYLGYTNGGVVDANIISGIGHTGIGGLVCNDLRIVNNNITTIGPGDGGGDAYGIMVSRENGFSETASPRSYRATIANNKVYGVTANPDDNGQGIDTHSGADFSIVGNQVDQCEVGIAAVSSVISGAQQLAPKRISIVGNQLNGLSVESGILISGALDGSTVNDYAEGIVISGNAIKNHGITNNTIAGAILVQATKGTVVSGNSIRNPRSVGISVNLENRGIVVTGNSITDPHDNTLTAPVCLRITGDNVSGYIGQNTFVYESSGLDTYVAVESIRVATGLTGIDLVLDQSQFIGIDATHLTYQELTSTGVSAGGLMSARGSGTLSSGTLAVTFAKRFPSTPKVFISLSDALNPIRAHTISATGFTAAGTGTDSFVWFATT